MAEVSIRLPDGTRLSGHEPVRRFGDETPIAQVVEALGVEPVTLDKPIRILPQDIPVESVVRVSGTGPHVNLFGL